MELSFHTQGVSMPSISEDLLNQWILKVALSHKKTVGEIAYIFCSDEVILETNQHYLQHDFYTDIITFDYTEGNKISGDIFIGMETVTSNAQEYEVPFNEELHRVIIHGILHLCGIDDQTPEQRENMEQEENKALALIKEYLTA